MARTSKNKSTEAQLDPDRKLVDTIRKWRDSSRGLTASWEINQLKWQKMRMRIKKTKNFPFVGCANLRMPTIETNDIGGLSTSQMTAMSTAQISGFATNQISNLSTVQISAISTARVSAISTAQLKNLNSAQFSSITTAQIGNLSTLQVSLIGTLGLASLTTDQIVALGRDNQHKVEVVHFGEQVVPRDLGRRG